MATLSSALTNEDNATPLYRALAANLPGAAIFVVNADLCYVLADGPALRDLGKTPADFEGKTVAEVLSSELGRAAETHYRQALAGQPFQLQHHQNGRDYETFGTPLRNNAGEVYAVLAVSYDITERTRAEVALNKSEAKYRTLFETMDEGFALCELIRDDGGNPIDYRYLEVNNALTKQSGLSPDAIVGKRATKAFPNLDRGLIHTYGQVVDTQQSIQAERFYPHVNIWFRLNAFPRGGDQFAVLFTNITESKRAEQAVRESEARLRRVLDGMGEGFGLLAPDFTIVEHNQEALRMDGRLREEIVGRSHWEVYGGTEDSELGHLLKKAMAERVPVSLEHRYAWEEGRALWLEMRAYPTEDGSLAVFWRDVTERRRAQDALRQNEEKFRTLADTAPALIWFNDETGENRFVNQQFLDYTGMTVEEIRGTGWHMLVHPDEKEAYIADYLAAVRERRAWQGQNRIRRYDGEWCWFDNHAEPLLAADGVYLGHVGVTVDITERKRREERQAFLLKFSDALRAEPTVDGVANRALQLLIEQLQLDRSYITSYYLQEGRADLDYQMGNDTVPPLPDHFVLSDYPEAFKRIHAGTLVIEDDFERQGLSEAERRNSGKLGMRAMVAATLSKGENKPLWSMVAISSRPRRWTPGEIALVEEVAERTWTAIERAKAEAAMRQSETRYRTLFEAIDEGFCIIQMLYDDAGHPVDWRFLQVNRAFELNNGLSNAEGKTIREMTPDIEPKWMEIYDLVARTGMPLRFEEESAALGRIFNLYAFRIGEPRERKVAVIFTDVTDRKRHEQRNAFLAELAEDFTINVTAEEIMRIVGEKIGRFLHISDCLFAEIDEGQDKADVRYNWHAPGLPDLAGVYRLSDFVTGEFLRMAREGEMIIINDTQTDGRVDAGRYAALHIHAYVTVPFHRGDEWKYLFTVNDSTARHWRPDEIELIEEVTRLTFPRIERARAEAELQKLNAQLEQRVLDRTEALRQSHTQLRELSTHMETTREDERTRIAREVHDELGGHLTALKIELGSLSWGRETDAALNQRLVEVKLHIDEIVGIVRRIGSDLRPPVLDDYGLIPAMEWHAHEWERRTGIACLLDLVEDKPPLSREKRTAVFRAFQEALTNVARHAQATKVNVTMALDQGELVLVIEDNGVGIQPDVLTFSNSLGLKGMQERMKEVGGEVEIEGLRGAGTVVLIRVPV